ncbi:MAG: RNA polymerase sigma factor RpoD/SigA, partial [Candidatus Gracilibacteria bacterium]|nr:RNA polymerase sigma factor RpoD/SigA [Candidatus Gracilibacteria bacterium]
TLMFSPNKKTEELITDARIIAKDIGKSDKDFEKILSKRREFFKRLKNGEIELIMDSEKKDMFSKIRTRGEIAIEKLTTANLRLVVSIAKSYIKRNRGNFLLLDIIQAGNIGLMKAVRKFNPTKFDNKFSTLASSWIRQSVDISIRNTGHMIRIAAHETENIRELRKIQVAFHKEFLRYPTSEELAKYLEISEEEIEERLTMMYQTSTSDLDRPIGENEENTLLDFQTDANISQAGDKMDNDVLGKVLRLLSGELTPREDQVIRLRFGIDEKQDYTLDEVGKKFNVTRERIRQIEFKALRRLKAKIGREKMKYEDFMG